METSLRSGVNDYFSISRLDSLENLKLLMTNRIC